MVKARVRQAWLWCRGNPVTFGLVLSALVTWGAVGFFGHETIVTKRTVERSPCTKDPASRECQVLSRQVARQKSLSDSCIPFEIAMTERGLVRFTRCREGVVLQNSQNASQSPGPSGEGSKPVAKSPDVVKPSNPPDSGNPSPSTTPSEPTEPTTPSEPTAPEPVAPAPAKPLIDLTPVTDPVCQTVRPLAAIC